MIIIPSRNKGLNRIRLHLTLSGAAHNNQLLSPSLHLKADVERKQNKQFKSHDVSSFLSFHSLSKLQWPFLVLLISK